MSRSQTSSLARGTSLYVICVAIAKVLGLVWIIPVTALIGPQGLGIYSNAYSVYNILQQFATSGFPLAMGKLVSEHRATGDRAVVEHIYRVTMRSLMVFSVIAFGLMWFGTPLFAHLISWRNWQQALAENGPSIRAVSLMLLVIPAMSGLRGYLQGFQRFEAPALSQTIEQLFRVLAMVFGAYLVVHQLHLDKAVDGAAAATFGGFVGGIAGLTLLVLAVVPLRQQERALGIEDSPFRDSQILRMVYRVAIPVSLGGLVVPIANVVDSWTVTNLLQMTGISLTEATKQFGILTRQAMYLVQLPMAFAYAIGVAILPAIATAAAKRRTQDIQENIVFSLRSMFLISFPTAAMLLVLSRPINESLFGMTQGSAIISTVSFMSVFSSLELISTYILQGLNQLYRPVRNMFLGVAVKTLFNVILILATHSVIGAAIATTIGYMCSSLLNVMAVRKYSNVQFSVRRIMGPFFRASILLTIFLLIVNFGLHFALRPLFGDSTRVFYIVQLLSASILGGLFYLYLIFRSGAITPTEVQHIPGIGRFLVRFSRRARRANIEHKDVHRYRNKWD